MQAPNDKYKLILQSIKNKIDQLKSKLSQSESEFWEYTKSDDHSKSDEIQLAKSMMVGHYQLHQLDLLKLFLIKISQEKLTYHHQIPLQYLRQFFNLGEISDFGNIFEQQMEFMLDNSEEIADYNEQTITEEQVKEYLINMYEKLETESDREWETDSNVSQREEDELLIADEKELAELENEADLLDQQVLQNKETQQQDSESVESLKQQEFEPQQIKFDEAKRVFNYHTETVGSIALSPKDKKTIASASCDESFCVFSIDEDKLIFKRDGFKETVGLIAYSYDGVYIAVALIDGQVYTYNKDFQEKLLEGCQSECIFLEWHPKGYIVLSGGEDSMIWMWNGINGDVLGIFTGHEGPITCGGFSIDGKYVLSGSEDKTFRIWKPKSQELAFKVQGHGFHNDDINCFAQHPVQQVIATGSNDKTVCLLSIETGKSVNMSQTLKSAIVSICFATNGLNTLAAGDFEGSIYVFDKQLRIIEKISISNVSITKISYKSNNQNFLAASIDGKFIQFDYRKIHEIKTIRCPSAIYDFLIIEDSSILACEDGKIYLY